MPSAVHIVAGLAPEDGGPSYSVPRLCATLRDLGCGVRILAVQNGMSSPQEGIEGFPQAARAYPVLRAMRLSPELARATARAANDCDIVHSHGLWLMPNVNAGHAATSAGKPLVVSPRGMLAIEALRFSQNQKRLFWHLMQKRAYAGAAAWHATSLQEASDIRDFGIHAPIAVIPNGIDLPEDVAQHLPSKTRRNLVFLSRLHPKKGLPNLVAAWAQLAPQRPDWELIIAGQDEGGHRAALETQIRSCGAERIRFTGPVYHEAKVQLLSKADLFVLPTRSENFGIAVAEALAAGVPAIVTNGAPWSGLADEQCGWWIEQGVEPLLSALLEATAMPAGERQAMGLRGREWMARDFSWTSAARQMLEVYRWLSDGGSPPDFVLMD